MLNVPPKLMDKSKKQADVEYSRNETFYWEIF